MVRRPAIQPPIVQLPTEKQLYTSYTTNLSELEYRHTRNMETLERGHEPSDKSLLRTHKAAQAIVQHPAHPLFGKFSGLSRELRRENTRFADLPADSHLPIAHVYNSFNTALPVESRLQTALTGDRMIESATANIERKWKEKQCINRLNTSDL